MKMNIEVRLVKCCKDKNDAGLDIVIRSLADSFRRYCLRADFLKFDQFVEGRCIQATGKTAKKIENFLKNILRHVDKKKLNRLLFLFAKIIV